MFGNITSKLVYGYLSDHIGTWKATFLFQGLVMVGVLLFILFPGSAVSLGIGTLCYGMMYALVNIGVNLDGAGCLSATRDLKSTRAR